MHIPVYIHIHRTYTLYIYVCMYIYICIYDGDDFYTCGRRPKARSLRGSISDHSRLRMSKKNIMDLVSGCLKVGRPKGRVRGGSMKDLLDLSKNHQKKLQHI